MCFRDVFCLIPFDSWSNPVSFPRETTVLDKIFAEDKVFVDFPSSRTIFLTKKKTELDYYYHKVNVRVASQISERLKTYDSRKLGNSEKIFEMIGINGECLAGHR